MNQLHGHVGDRLRVTYTLRNTSRLPKLWLEVHNPTTLPVPLPGRAHLAAVRGASGRWVAQVPLTRRGHFRVEPLQIRTGDPFGFFESSASVGHGGHASIVYPRVEPLPRWSLPGGHHRGQPRGARSGPSRRRRWPRACGRMRRATHEPDPLEDHGPPRRDPGQGVRPRADRRRLDLPRPRAAASSRRGRRLHVEVAIRAAASIADRALDENRAVGMTVIGHRTSVLPAGPRRPPAPQDHAAPRRRRG